MTLANSRRRGVLRASDDPRALPEGSLPCRWCGIAVFAPQPSQSEFIPLAMNVPFAGMRNSAPPIEIPVSRCADCTARHRQAELLVRDHPQIRRENGTVAADRIDAMLAAFDALGDRRGKLAATLTATDDGLRELIDAMATFGAAAAWSAGYATAGTCEPRRWAHVSVELKRNAKAAHATLIRRRSEPSWPYSPPSSNDALAGCGLCGVGTLRATESKAREAWGPEFRLHTGTLGGANRPEPVVAHLCPACRASVAKAGLAVGMPAVWGALLRFRGYEPREAWQINSMDGVVAWAALRPGTKPNETPWAHVNLAAVDAELAVSPYVRKRVAA